MTDDRRVNGSASKISPLASELNNIIEKENSHVFDMLSDFGKRIYFPKGILSQSAEAKDKAKKFDATIGIAKENGKPMFLPSIMKHFPTLSPADALTYAPATGRADLRSKWNDLLKRKNPTLAGKKFSTPAVTSGVTHALNLVGDLFVNEGDIILLPDMYWENYDLLFNVRYRAEIELYPFFNSSGGFDTEKFAEALSKRPAGSKTIVILNFPNNPTGYSVTQTETIKITAALKENAERGCDIVVVTDDAYFGLFYNDDVLQESIFAHVADLHPRILAIKVDGPTKEQFVWGFRTGMLTFAAKTNSNADAFYGALDKKVSGAIRSAISNCSQPVQSVLAIELGSEVLDAEHDEKRNILESRAKKAMEILSSSDFSDVWEPYPFNAGYFMCLKMKNINAELFRTHLLNEYGIGVIANGDTDIRVAFSAVEIGELQELYETMAKAARELK